MSCACSDCGRDFGHDDDCPFVKHLEEIKQYEAEQIKKMVCVDGAKRIVAERKRQLKEWKWSADHDDNHTAGQLAWAAVCYAAPDYVYRPEGGGPQITFNDPWPWTPDRDKREERGSGSSLTGVDAIKARIHELEKAGALIAAEIDRQLRLLSKAVKD